MKKPTENGWYWLKTSPGVWSIVGVENGMMYSAVGPHAGTARVDDLLNDTQWVGPLKNPDELINAAGIVGVPCARCQFQETCNRDEKKTFGITIAPCFKERR